MRVQGLPLCCIILDAAIDPACGTFGFMIAAHSYVRRHTDDFFDFDADVAEFERKEAFTGCELVLHTVLRLPTGIFYAQGVKTNVLFFTRGKEAKGNSLDLGFIRDESVVDYEDFPDPAERGREDME